jgi:hypothetical protein
MRKEICNFNVDEGGDVNVLIYLLNLKGIGVNMKGSDDRTILHSAW